ncbi:MAG TPA: ribonuclease P protein component [Candidatus Aphodocola excrementigallinarum]|uniref:Ribonuclease P protein component n=1 Tax=Candidatus Aphodocola excrementigallinarum TaxID=2840670 RepID=A0A9D1IN14_9FIRM|nr:ribonuclease P protein component [Candidatus Aphodocola excrementigallinarum]
MKKRNIVKEKKDFDIIFKLRNQTSSKFYYIYIKDNDLNKFRFGICVSKKLGNAVTRNKLKRRVKDIIDKSKLHFESKDYIIVLKKSAKSAKYLELKEDLISVLKKIIDR